MRRILLLLGLLGALSAAAQQASNPVIVDESGVMRLGKGGAELYGFGVNYTLPFAFAYRNAKKSGLDLEREIDRDLYHFARLGFDLFRVHIWDTEISDTLGNLLENDKLRLFDYQVAKMRAQGMRMVLTPIAYWGNGWPQPDEETPGFSAKYGKDACLTNPKAIRAQEQYLVQLLNHVNPYTQLAYKDDPAVLAFEVSNEPHHAGTPKEVTSFINRMVAAMRSTGCQKPIFYNISHKVHLADAYFNAAIQGGTFQWYPTGLGAQRELGGNLLPNVDRYDIPFAHHPGFRNRAKFVYEFDAADVGRSYIYPAMARSFREAGFQLATHFAYDPLYSAYANPEYNTHYMNLAYTPAKAISLMISGEVFRHIPRYASFGSYPENTRFGPFRVDYTTDLAELVLDTVFYHTNNTATVPPQPVLLRHIAGTGSSPVVQYAGTGAYFLDKLEPGVWRLEVMPDAIWVHDPFGRNSLDRAVAKINYAHWEMAIQLPDLSPDFEVVPLTKGTSVSSEGVQDGRFDIEPGTWLLVRKGVTHARKGADLFRFHRMDTYIAPAQSLEKTYVLHEALPEISTSEPIELSAIVAGPEVPVSVELVAFQPGGRWEHIPMMPSGGYTYRVQLPANKWSVGMLHYYIVVRDKLGVRTFPSDIPKSPVDWDFFDPKVYETKVVGTHFPIVLFDAQTDAAKMDRPWLPKASVQPTARPDGGAALHLVLDSLGGVDAENLTRKPVVDYSARFFFGAKVAGRRADLKHKKWLRIEGRSLTNAACTVQLALIQPDGTTYGGLITLKPQEGIYSLDISALKPVELVTLPRPYPTFLPYFFKGTPASFLLRDVETLQISLGPGQAVAEVKTQQGVAVIRIWLE